MASRTTKTIRSGVIGFVAGVAALGVVATAQPLHRAVSSAVGAEPATSAAATRTPKAAQELWSPPQTQDQWLIPQDQSQQQPYVQPAPQQAPQSQAS